MNHIKTTSFQYGNDYQNKQVEKYKNRETNHWKYRIEIFNTLLNNVLPNFEGKQKKDITIVDIGCSIGTFALETAKNGFNAIGIDFDNDAINIAKQLAEEENIKAKFICGDISQNIDFNNKIDIAVCFDIFEHLHDDEIGAFLQSIKSRLSENGVLIYHTFPTQYDYLFFQNKLVRFPLILFSFLGKKAFLNLTKIYAKKIDILLILFKGKTQKERIKNFAHCNPLTKSRLKNILERAGFENKIIEVSQLYDFNKKTQKIFKKHEVSFRNLYGIAYPKK
ncbi:MAG: class I SAM-dependent methyltransferase [Bacteroidales bacterium]|nr:class I SAM-dependent methyltransferase [Bacteroidales bacterium]MBN2756498.1 class I SAM-dependent methyltransferase [Bacteroidales bacterium]